MFTCDKCTKQFSNKYLLQRHMLNKLPCDSPKKLILINNNKCDKYEEDISNLDIQIQDYNIKLNELNVDISTLEQKINLIDENININTNKIDLYIEKSDNKQNKCWFCKKIFTTKQNKMRHINESCEKKGIIDEKINKLEEKKNKLHQNKDKLTEDKNKITEEKNNILKNKENLQQELKNMKLQNNEKIKSFDYRNEMNEFIKKQLSKIIMKQSKQTPQNINITNNNNSKVINNNLIVNINNFGKEDLSHVTLNDYKKYLSGYFQGFLKFIEKVHFDENAPENHNINITNLKSKYLHIYENNKWTAKEKKDVLDKFINKKYNFLVDKCEELEESNQLSEKIIEDFIRFTQNYKDEEALKNTEEKVLLMIYNNKDKIDMKQ